jgi:hypothetical protein
MHADEKRITPSYRQLTAEMEIGFERLDQPALLDLHLVETAVEQKSAAVAEEVGRTPRRRACFPREPAFSSPPSAHSCLNQAIE